MAVEHIHTYLVHPGKSSSEAPQIGGATVSLRGKLFTLLNEIYLKSHYDCNIAISFNQSSDGSQNNQCRSLIIDYLSQPTLVRGRQIAERLEKVTTHRSGLGLLFLIAGQEGAEHKIVVSRFPTDSAILAEENRHSLNVEFLERVFMKSATSYKAAAYQDSSLTAGFWMGHATDKQINNQTAQISNYWISDFLDSDFRTTSAAGTRRLAIALRNASRKSADLEVRKEIAAAVTLARGLNGRRLSITEFGERLQLSDAAKQAISDELKAPSVAAEKFKFDMEEFSKIIAYRSIELDSGAILTAPSSEFDQVFQKEIVDPGEQTLRFSAEGQIINEKIGKVK